MWAGFHPQELVVMGAPGSYYWTGTIKVYNLTSDSFYSPNKENVDSHRYSYLGESLLMRMNCTSVYKRSCDWFLSMSPGYAVTAGHFSSPNVIDVAAGAPQHSGSGKVGTSSFVCFPAVDWHSSCVACYSDLFLSCTSSPGLHFQNRRRVFGEEFSSLRENGMNSDVVLCSCF